MVNDDRTEVTQMQINRFAEIFSTTGHKDRLLILDYKKVFIKPETKEYAKKFYIKIVHFYGQPDARFN